MIGAQRIPELVQVNTRERENLVFFSLPFHPIFIEQKLIRSKISELRVSCFSKKRPPVKPSLKKLVRKAKAIHERHRERHRPSGFGFALADSIDYLDAARWEDVTRASSVYLSPQYLRVLEAAGPDNLRQRYALIFQGREAVAAVAAQVVTISAAKLPKSKAAQMATKPLERLEERMLVCGNLLSWGMHGVRFAPHVERAEVWPAVAEALYRLRRADRLFGDTDLVLLKDVPPEHATGIDALKRFSYRELETEPNMVLAIAPTWKNYDDYLASLTSSYRKTARKITKDVEAAGGRVERLSTNEIINTGAVIHDLYSKVHERQKLRLITLSPEFIPSLAATFGDDFRCNVIRKDDQTLGFVTTLKDGDTAVGYYIGFDSAANAEMPLYFRLLQAVIEDAIALGCTRLSLGRTALEPKARLGAKPEPMSVWIRHRIQAMNLVVRGLLSRSAEIIRCKAICQIAGLSQKTPRFSKSRYNSRPEYFCSGTYKPFRMKKRRSETRSNKCGHPQSKPVYSILQLVWERFKMRTLFFYRTAERSFHWVFSKNICYCYLGLRLLG
jgi:hypothetical protein